MLPLTGTRSYLIMLALAFVAIFLLLIGLYMLWKSYKGPEAKKIEQRLQALFASLDATAQSQLLKQRMLSSLPFIERLLLDAPRLRQFDRFLYQAGVNWTVSHFLLSCLLCGVAGYALVMLLLPVSFLGALAVGLLAAMLPFSYVHWKRHKRLMKLEVQLPDALDLLIRALRAGHAFHSGLQMIGEEMAEPIANEFRIVHDEVNFGVSLQQALTNLSERVPLLDLRYFVVALLVQRESGGNLAEVLGNLSLLIRNRLKLRGKIKVLSSEGRMSAWVLVVMPFAMGGLMYMANPEFMAPLWEDPAGLVVLKVTLCLMAVGVFIMSRIIRIRV